MEYNFVSPPGSRPPMHYCFILNSFWLENKIKHVDNVEERFQINCRFVTGSNKADGRNIMTANRNESNLQTLYRTRSGRNFYYTRMRVHGKHCNTIFYFENVEHPEAYT